MKPGIRILISIFVIVCLFVVASGQMRLLRTNNYSLAAGKYHSTASLPDGSLTSWGLNHSGQCEVPPGNDFIAIAAGGYHSLASKADGTIVAWGLNYSGQCGLRP